MKQEDFINDFIEKQKKKDSEYKRNDFYNSIKKNVEDYLKDGYSEDEIKLLFWGYCEKDVATRMHSYLIRFWLEEIFKEKKDS